MVRTFRGFPWKPARGDGPRGAATSGRGDAEPEKDFAIARFFQFINGKLNNGGGLFHRYIVMRQITQAHNPFPIGLF
ncbi:hypothetical protein EMIT0111MI5_190025 [Burkholderia sp. IT-111MI5]